MDLNTREGRKQQGARIQRAAEAAGLSLEELAREIGCSRALIYQYVSGGVLAQPTRLQKIGLRTGHPLTYFYEDGSETTVPEPETEAASFSPDSETSPAELASVSGMYEGYSGAEAAVESRDRLPESLLDRPMAASPADDERHQLVARVALPYLEELADAQEAGGDSLGLLSSCERIIPFARQLGDRTAEARAWLRIGNARITLGHPELALPALRVALALFEAMGNVRLALSCRQGIGHAYLTRGDTDSAMAEFQRVAAGPDWTLRWQGEVSQAAVHEHLGDFRAALDRCDAALDLIEKERGVSIAAMDAARSYVLSNQVNVYLGCGDFPDAMGLSQRLLLSAERASRRDQFIEALINLGICQFYRGEWDLAEENLLRAIDLGRFSGDRPRQGFARAWLATLLARSGDLDRARDEAKDSLHLALETSSRRTEIQAQLALGDSYLRGRSLREARYHFDQAVTAAVSSSTVVQQSLALCRRGEAHLALGDADAARSDGEEALFLSGRFGVQVAEAKAQLLMARILARTGDREGAIGRAEAAASLAGRLSLAEPEIQAAALMASLCETSDRTAALRWGERAVQGLQRLRDRVRRRREEEALLEDPDRLSVYQEQALRLARAGGDPWSLIDRAAWPPLVDWAHNSISADAGSSEGASIEIPGVEAPGEEAAKE